MISITDRQGATHELHEVTVSGCEASCKDCDWTARYLSQPTQMQANREHDKEVKDDD